MKKCPNCGHEAETKFCTECGAQMADPAPYSSRQDSEVNTLPEEVISPYEENTSGESSNYMNTSDQTGQTSETDSLQSEKTNTKQNAASGSDTYSQAAGENRQNNETYNYKFTGDSNSASSDFKTPDYTIPKQEGVSYKTWFVILFLVIFWPVGLYLMWSRKKFTNVVRIIITAGIGVLFILNIALSARLALTSISDIDLDTNISTSSQESTKSTTEPNTSSDSVTLGEKNALESAKDYLDYSAFSYQGLIEQLEFEGYSNSESVYAADHCGADWNNEAARMAQEYIDFMSFSRQELVEQLEFEGFTSEQAEYGVKAVGY